MPGYLNVIGTGANLDWLKQVPDESVDSVVTDPPYGLGQPPPIADVMRAWLDGGDYAPSGGGFMSKEWDAFVPGPTIWRECYRILKPGGWLLSFFGARTYDVGTVSIRFAGFEVRDQIDWIYSTGFPKSHNVSKALDAAAGAVREQQAPRSKSRPSNSIEKRGFNADGWAPTVDTPITEAAQRWHGYGTALKPSHEPMTLAQKPCAGTIADCALTHGTGVLNIDASRIGLDRMRVSASDGRIRTDNRSMSGGNTGRVDMGTKTVRWPPNVMFRHRAQCADDCAPDCPAAELDRQSGFNRSTPSMGNSKSGCDSGGASRFFYCAKAPTKERWAFCSVCDVVFCWVGNAHTEHDDHKEALISHPTQKPVRLMEYLIRLVTPPGGVVVDPFCGTGSTAVAAERLGHPWITCDLDPNYVRIAQTRIAQVKAPTAARAELMSGSVFCPGCRAQGKISLIDKDTLSRARELGRKVSCMKCMMRFPAADLLGR